MATSPTTPNPKASALGNTMDRGNPSMASGSTGSGGHRSYNSKQRLNNGHLSSSSSSYRDATTQCFWAMRNMVHRVSNLT